MATSQSTLMAITLTELPVEILTARTIPILDDQSLLNLGRVNHYFNHIAIRELFDRNNVHGIANGCLIAHSLDNLPRVVGPALGIAFWITQLNDINFHLNPDIQQMLGEVHGLTALIERLPSLRTLDISFHKVDDWGRGLELLGHKPVIKWTLWQLWVKVLGHLFDAALASGLQSISIRGAHSLSAYVETKRKEIGDAQGKRASRPLRERTGGILFENQRGLKDKLSQWFSKRIGDPRIGSSPTSAMPCIPSATGPTPIQLTSSTDFPSQDDVEPSQMWPVLDLTQAPQPCLARISIASTMLLEKPPFIHRTVRILSAHSQTVQYLQLENIIVLSDTWTNFFGAIHLPMLRCFRFIYDAANYPGPSRMTVPILHDFLVRHPSIVTLELYGITIFNDLPQLNRSLLPNLHALDVHPRVAVWLLEEPSWYPHLDSICLSSELGRTISPTFSTENEGYSHFDSAISAVAAISHPVTLEFEFNTREGLYTWMNGHIQSNSKSVFRNLRNITHVSLRHLHTRHTSSQAILALVPQWLALFPSLEVLQMDAQPHREEVQNREFYRAVLSVCLHLKSFKVNGINVDKSSVF